MSKVARFSPAKNDIQALSEELLSEVRGGSGIFPDPPLAPPQGTPEYTSYQQGMETRNTGVHDYFEGMGIAAGSQVLPPPADVVGGLAGAGMAWEAADVVEQGQTEMQGAHDQYYGSGGQSIPEDTGNHDTNRSIEPNMSMADGSYGYNGESLGYGG
jgi:hypothetical protein